MRILFITQTNIGDVILSTVLLDRILADYPNAIVDVAAGGRSVDIFEGMPNLGELHPIVKRKKHGHYFDMWKKFIKHRYDVIVDLRGSALSYVLRGKKKIRSKIKNKNTHKAVQLAALWKSEKPLHQRVWATNHVLEKVKAEVAPHKGYMLIGIASTANWIGKTWPQRHFAQLVSKISNQQGYENVKFVLFGAAHERRQVEDFVNHIPEEKKVDLIGKTTLTEAYAWMTHLDAFIGNDSGLSHLSAAADVPTFTLFGPTWENLYAPVGDNTVIITPSERDDANLETKMNKRIMPDIQPAHVLEEFISFMNHYKTKKKEEKSA